MGENQGKAIDAEAKLRGQAEIWNIMFNFSDSMALKCAVELRIADIIHSHGCPITLSQIISSLDNYPSSDLTCLARIMRLLVRKNIFAVSIPSDGGDALYGLTHSSTWLLHDAELTLAPMILMENDPRVLAPWHCLSRCVNEGISAFRTAHGRDLFDYALVNSDFNQLFNDGMACTAKLTMNAILTTYQDGFRDLQTVVDVGGGTGAAVAAIVRENPNVKGINFDLPHVVCTAPEYPKVTHIGGDMFKEVPAGDAVFMKWIMHDWSDDDCVKILKNCRKAVPEKKGKVIIVDAVLNPEGQGLFDNTGVVFDLLMMAHTFGGKERTEMEWKKLLEEAGFPRYKIVNIPAFLSVIEAYPE